MKNSHLEKYYKEAATILGISYEDFFSQNWRTRANLADKFRSFAGDNGVLRGIQYQRASAENRDLSNLYKDKLFS